MAASTDTRVDNPNDRHCIAVTVVEEGGGDVPVKMKKGWGVKWEVLHLPSLLERVAGPENARRLTHSMKVGVALVLVSLLYILDVVHDRLGDDAMWAVMTVVVMFELTSGATIGKGVNRGIGTICGGGLGTLVSLLAQYAGGWGRALIIATSLFLFCAAATYTRMIPRIKKRYDYGVMIFILTFSLIAVTGSRGNQIIKVATDRLWAVFTGFATSILVNLLVFPVWAGDELHASLVSKIKTLAPLVQENVQEYFKTVEEKSKEQSSGNFKGCISVLYSKAADESLANFAKWEPWHGRFGFFHPWDKYLETGEQLRDLAVSILSLRSCIKSKYQENSMVTSKEQCEAVGALITNVLGEMGAHFEQMTVFEAREMYAVKLAHKRQELSAFICLPELKSVNQNHIIGAQNTFFFFVLMNIVDKLEQLVKKVEELEVVGRFRP